MMMNYKLFPITFFVFLFSCKKQNISAENFSGNIVGKWNNSYQLKTKNPDGKWSEWYTVNTLVALPVLEFTEKGKVLWDGKPATECCTYQGYLFIDRKIKFVEPTIGKNYEAVDCFDLNIWKVEKLTDTLEVELFITKARYLRVK